MKTPYKVTFWPDGVPPAAGPGEPRLRFALRREPVSVDAILGLTPTARLVVLRDWTWIGGRIGYFCDAVLNEHKGVASHDNFMCARHDCIAIFDFLPPVEVVKALAESQGLRYCAWFGGNPYVGDEDDEEGAA